MEAVSDTRAREHVVDADVAGVHAAGILGARRVTFVCAHIDNRGV
jgi:hypothetical protein